MGTPAVGVLLVICTTEFSTCLNIVLRGKGLEEELAFWEDEVLEFIRCCCATAVDGSINRTYNDCCKRKLLSHWVMLRTIHQIYSYASSIQIHADGTVL